MPSTSCGRRVQLPCPLQGYPPSGTSMCAAILKLSKPCPRGISLQGCDSLQHYLLAINLAVRPVILPWSFQGPAYILKLPFGCQPLSQLISTLEFPEILGAVCQEMEIIKLIFHSVTDTNISWMQNY